MLRYIVCLTALFLGAQVAVAEPAMPWDVVSVEMHEVPDSGPLARASTFDDCGKMNPADLSGVDWNTVVTVGQQIWSIVQANKPVVNVSAAEAFALPGGLTCWMDLDGWKAPQSKSFEVVYKNLMGMEVVKFRFRLQYTYGGGRSGVGQYLANVTVMPAELNVMWAYTFNAQVEVEKAVNIGTAMNPIAGLEMNLKWDVGTVLKSSQNSYHFFVQGDGQTQVAQ